MLPTWKTIALVLLFAVGATLLWGVAIEPRLIAENHYQVSIPGLPPAWRGKEVAYFGDLQVGMFLDNEGTISRIVNRVLRERPAVVLIGGDFIYHPTEDDSKTEAREEFEQEDAARVRSLIAEVIALLRPLPQSGLPTYAVLGNHDFGMQTPQALKLPWVAAELEQALEGIGIAVLNNEAVALENPGTGKEAAAGPLFLVGIGASYPGRADVDRALADLPAAAPRLVLMHNPQSFARFPAGAAPLAVAGHTHGGQIRIPFLKSWSWLSIVQEGEVHADGWIGKDFGAPGNRLYVNRGIGFSGVPIRINCLPELTYFSLR